MEIKSNNSFTSLIKATMNPANYRRGRIVRKAAVVVDKYVTDLSQRERYLKTPPAAAAAAAAVPSRTVTTTTTATAASGTENLSEDTETTEASAAPANQQEKEELGLQELPSPEPIVDIPLFHRDELRLGNLLGEGGFCQVWEVSGIVLMSGTIGGDDNIGDDDDDFNDGEDQRHSTGSQLHTHTYGDYDGIAHCQDLRRKFVQELESGVSTAKFAAKQLRKRLTRDPARFTQAVADLIVEAQYLSRLSHPHIVKVRGMTMGGIQPMKHNGRYDAYFLLLDRLESTLERRIQLWQRGQDECTYQEKLQYALQIASGLQYLHRRRIIFRDLKPQNIGFLSDSKQLQLFDFGLVRELPPPRIATRRSKEEERKREEQRYGESSSREDSSEHEEEEEEENFEDYYQMTRVGTRRYAAVEIHISGRYNEKVDVYSWAMTVYEMISLNKPFASLTDRDHQELVCAQGRRPNMKPFLQQCEQPLEGGHPPISTLMRQAWEQYVRNRIDIHTIVDRMEEIVQAGTPEKAKASNTATVSEASAAADPNESIHFGDFASTPGNPLNKNGSNKKSNNSTSNSIIINDDNNNSINNSSNNSALGSKKGEKTDSFELGEEDLTSIQSLVVDIDGASKHSVVSAPSMATVSGSNQTASIRWDDSINTSSAYDASLNTVVFEEYLRPRQQS